MLQSESEDQQSLPHEYEASSYVGTGTPVLKTSQSATTASHQRTASRKSRIILACKRCKRRKHRVRTPRKPSSEFLKTNMNPDESVRSVTVRARAAKLVEEPKKPVYTRG